MMKHLKIFFFGMAVIVLIAGSAFAGSTKVNVGATNASLLVSLEAMGAARNVTISGTAANSNTPGNATIAYVSAQPLVTNNLLTVSFVGAAFTGAPLNFCGGNAPNADQLVANATPTAGSTNANFQLSLPAGFTFGSGNFAYLTQSACGAAGMNVPVQISATAASANPTVQIQAITSGGVSIDPSTAVKLATIAPEYSVVNNSSAHTVDFLSTPFNGTKIISGGGAPNTTADSNGAGTANTVGVLVGGAAGGGASNSFTTNGSNGAQNAGLTVSMIVDLQDSASWQGVTKVWLMPAGNACAIATNVVANTSPANTVALAIPATAGANNSFNGTATGQFDLCVLADGVSSLQARTITASDAITVSGSGSGTVPAAPYANAQVWTLNAYQALVPFMVNSALVPTFCLVNNADPARTGTVLVDVLSSEGSVVLSNVNVGSVASKQSQLFSFTGNEIDAVSTTGVATKVADLTTLGANVRYSARTTVTVNPANISVTCIQTDPATGVKRAVPVLTSAAVPFKQ